MARIYKISIISSLAGFLFGFDTVVISGADQQLQNIWNTSDIFHGSVVMSMALWGTVLGALLASYPCDKFGRKKTLLLIGFLYLISALGSAFANDPNTFSLFRFLGGIGIGLSTVAAPTYISEIAPTDKRGRLVILYQFNLVFGILIAYTSNYFFQNFGEGSWRWMMGVEAFPAFLYLIGLGFIPESPRWLVVKKNNISLAKKIHKEINHKLLTKDELSAFSKNINKSEPLFCQKYFKPLMFAFFISFFNQLSGINAFLYYAPRIFEIAGLKSNSAFLSSIGIGLINLIFTILGMYLIDKMGRKTLLKIGSVGYIFSLSMIAISFIDNWGGIFVPLFLFVFIASHAVGQGSIIWVFTAEIFPNHLRAKGLSFGISVHWILASLITLLMPSFLSILSNPGYIFLFFAFVMIFQLIFALTIMPETKNISLEELTKKLMKNT
tara:strand:+ start:530 stop:1846 length:1317 start_codon:yes stop_codon:yes gene_type:complete